MDIVLNSYEDDDYCVHESMTINGDKSLSVHPLYDCPEDAIIGRDLVSCTDVIESYTISVKLGAVASTDLNETFTRNTAGNSLIWDKMNSVPVAADPNVISMSSSNTAILTNTYTVTVTVRLVNAQIAAKDFTVKIMTPC